MDALISHYEMHPGSLIARIYGVYTLINNEFKPIDLIIMQNTAVVKHKRNKIMEFDLKGSSIDRYSKVEGDKVKTLKDKNFLEL